MVKEINKSLREATLRLREDLEKSYFQFAANLRKIKEKQLFYSWGFRSFKDYVERELKFVVRTAERLISVHKFLEDKVLKPEQQARLLKLGWSVVYEIKNEIKSEKDIDKWVQLAEEKPVSELRVEKAKSSGGLIRKSFALTPEQASNVDKAFDIASKQAKSDKPSHLLDLIATHYLSMNLPDDSKEAIKVMLQQIEVNLGIRLIALIPPNKVIYGEDLLEAD